MSDSMASMATSSAPSTKALAGEKPAFGSANATAATTTNAITTPSAASEMDA
jgi:hypothetical protein